MYLKEQNQKKIKKKEEEEREEILKIQIRKVVHSRMLRHFPWPLFSLHLTKK